MVTDPLRVVWRRVKRAAFAVQRLRYHRVAHIEALGLIWSLDLRDGLQRELALSGDYEKEVRELLLAELHPGDVFVDIGGNIGVLSLPIAKARPDVEVLAFEPMPTTAAIFRAGAERAQLRNVQLVEMAIGAERGFMHLKRDPWFGNADTGVVSAYGIGRPAGIVPVDRLDSVLDVHGVERVDVIKIDIEGGEYHALLGMPNVLRELRPRVLVIELQPALMDRAGVHAGAVEELLAAYGYRVARRLDRNVVFNRG